MSQQYRLNNRTELSQGGGLILSREDFCVRAGNVSPAIINTQRLHDELQSVHATGDYEELMRLDSNDLVTQQFAWPSPDFKTRSSNSSVEKHRRQSPPQVTPYNVFTR